MRSRWAQAVVAGACALAAGCSSSASGSADAGESHGVSQNEPAEYELRLGRVHISLTQPYTSSTGSPTDAATTEGEADDDTDVEEEAFEVSARFALVRGLEEDFVRARANIPLLADELLESGQCASYEAIWAEHPELAPAARAGSSSRQLVLVDAGHLEVDIADAHIDIPLELVPDLLPYMSGVEYSYIAQSAATRMPGSPHLTVRAAGGDDDDQLPAFEAAGNVPRPLSLHAGLELESALVLTWDDPLATPTSPGGSLADEVVLQLQMPRVSAEAPATSVYCVVPDLGRARLDLNHLKASGLDLLAPEHAGAAVHLSISRTNYALFDAGSFHDAELLIERRSSFMFD